MSVGLGMIVKDEAERLSALLPRIRPHVDVIVVVDTGSTDETRSVALAAGATVCSFDWRDDFAAARNSALDALETDWLLWLDADDLVIGAEHIRAECDSATSEQDAIAWRYVIGRDAKGDANFVYWRERLLRRSAGWRWRGAVHEALIVPGRPARIVYSENVLVEHHARPASGAARSRNLRILEREFLRLGDNLETRARFYYGRELAEHGRHADAAEQLAIVGEASSWLDERYLARIGESKSRMQLGAYREAAWAAALAMLDKPEWPEAYFALAEIAYLRQQWANVLHWVTIARHLPSPERTLFVDRAALRHGWMIWQALACYHLGELREALTTTRIALERDPGNVWHRQNLRFFAGELEARAHGGDSPPIGA